MKLFKLFAAFALGIVSPAVFASTYLFKVPLSGSSAPAAASALSVSNLPVNMAMATNSFLLASDGSLWGVGQNLGSLGDGTKSNYQYSFEKVGTNIAGSIAEISSGNGTTLALTSDGKVWGTGTNGAGQLGDGTGTNRVSFEQVGSTITNPVKAVAAANSYTVVLDSNGKIWATGMNSRGQLGDGTTAMSYNFHQVGSTIPGTITQIAAGQSTPLALTSTGQIWGTGYNADGELGDGTYTNATSYKHVGTNIPTAVKAIGAGEGHSVALTTDGKLWATGANSYGELGDGTTYLRNTWEQVGTYIPVPIVSIAVGATHTVALASDGTLWATGDNSNGELGDGTTVQRTSFLQVGKNIPGTITAIAAGVGYTQVMTSDGKVWVAGIGSELGFGSTSSNITTFTQVTLP